MNASYKLEVALITTLTFAVKLATLELLNENPVTFDGAATLLAALKLPPNILPTPTLTLFVTKVPVVKLPTIKLAVVRDVVLIWAGLKFETVNVPIVASLVITLFAETVPVTTLPLV